MSESSPQLANNILAHKMLNSDAKSYLLERGIEEKIALDLGYFSVSKSEGKDLINQNIGGMAITYFDLDKKPIAYRLRPFKRDWNIAINTRDYYLENKGELPKFLSKPKGKSENLDEQRINKAYFSTAIEWKKVQQKSSIDILITEGEVKASLACLSNIPTIALAGVSSIYNRLKIGKEEIREFLPELEWECKDNEFRQTYWDNRNVGLCFDSDIVSKWQVQNALINLANELKKRGANVFLVLLPSEHDGGKNGIDDFITRHGSEAFKKLVEQFKILQKSSNRLLVWDEKAKTYRFNQLEPINSIKGLMVWSVLKDQIAYREGFGWYEWSGKYWKMIPESKVLGLIQEFRYCNEWLTNSDKPVFEDFKNALSKNEIEWNNSQILGFENGYLDTSTNELIPHDKSLYLTAILPFNYNQSSGCPQWLNFLNNIFDGDQDKIQYLRAWFKWILAPKPENFPIEATLWLVGKQGTGKGTLLSVLRALVGKDNYGGFEPDLITNPNHLFGLVDKKLALNSDATGFIGNVGIYNRICSNEPVTVKNLYHNQFDTPLNTVTVLAMNKPIGFPSGGSEGLSRRLHVLKLDKIPSRRDPDLKEKLLGELQGIFAWCWGLSMVQVKQILNWRVEDAVSEIYENQITEILFLKETYPEGNNCVKASDLYSEYFEWCKNNGYKSANSQNFYLALKKIKGVEKIKQMNANYYTIPKMENYHDPEFGITTDNPTNIIKNTKNVMESSCNMESNMEYVMEGFDQDSERVMEGMEGFEQKNFCEGKELDTPIKKVSEKPSRPSINQTQQDIEPSMKNKDTLQPSINQTQQGIEGKTQNNQDDLSIYKGFQSVGKLNSSDIREARNRSEKIKADILACTNNEELKLVREDFGYLSQEIEWVWVNLLTKREKAQIKQMTEQNQGQLSLENEENLEPEIIEIDFLAMVREIKEILFSLGNDTDARRKEAMREITGLDKKLKDYTYEEWLEAYGKIKKLRRDW